MSDTLAAGRTYAVGDIHGEHALLLVALDKIEKDAGDGPAHIVFLGDYVDRGPASRSVIETLMAGPRREGDTFTCLQGNHEDLMLGAAAGDPAAESCWIGNGGGQTCLSYGGAIPPEHLNWIDALPVLHETEHHVFVHAGLMPGLEIHQQERETLLWIRERFLRDTGGWAKHVVHGHTPQWDCKPDATKPELLPYRTNLDTGACWTGVLTVGVFDGPGGPKRLLTATVHDVARQQAA